MRDQDHATELEQRAEHTEVWQMEQDTSAIPSVVNASQVRRRTTRLGVVPRVYKVP